MSAGGQASIRLIRHRSHPAIGLTRPFALAMVRAVKTELPSEAGPVSATTMNPSSNFIWLHCKSWIEGLLLWGAAFTSGRWWLIKTTLLCVTFTILVAGGIGFQSLHEGYLGAYYEKIEHPLKDLTKIYKPGGHEAKLNYRLTVPVVLHVLGLHSRWVLPVLTVLAIIALLYLTCLLSYRITGSRVVALFVGLEVASTYIGSFDFIMGFDAVALVLVLLAGFAGIPWQLRGLICFAAAFTDERGLLALLFLLPLFSKFTPGRSWEWRGIINRNTLAISGAILLYFIVRLWMHFGMGMGSTIKGVGPGSFAEHVKHWHAGVWFALEGGWLFVVLATASLYLRKQFMRLVIFLVPITGMLLGGFMNGDLVRTTAYLLPAVFVSLQVLREHETVRPLSIFAVFAFLASVIGGNYNVFRDEITWFMPLPVYILNLEINAFVLWAKTLVGWRD